MTANNDTAPEPLVADDPLSIAVEATRLLGRWSLVSQKHEAGCSCCPGLGDVDVAEVEKDILADLRARHEGLETVENIGGLLKSFVARGPAPSPASRPALLADIDRIIGILEQMQRGW